jgi:hypothetical protein
VLLHFVLDGLAAAEIAAQSSSVNYAHTEA